VTQTPPSGSPGGYPRHSSDWPGTSPQYGSGGVHYPSETPADRGSESNRRQSTAGDKWVDRRLDKFGRLMGMRDRPDPDPFRGLTPQQTAPAPAPEPGTAAQQVAATQPAQADADQVTGPQQALSQPVQPAETRVPLYPDPGQPYADPPPSYADPGRPYADPGRPYADPGRPYADPGRPYADPAQQQRLGHGPYGDPGRPATPLATPPAAGQPTHAGGIPATPYASPPAAGLEYPYRAYSYQESGPPGPARGYGAAPEPAAPEPAAQTYGAQTYGAQPYATQAHASQASPAESYGSLAFPAPSYGSQAYGPGGYATHPYSAPDYTTHPYSPQGYPARQSPSAPNTGAERSPAPAYAPASYAPASYAPASYAPASYAPSGYAGQDYGSSAVASPAVASPAVTDNPAAPGAGAAGPSWEGAWPGAATAPDASSRPATSAPAAGFPATRPDAPSAVAAADPSAEPLYGVLGGLALRDLTLVESLLEIVEQLESREEDPQQLDSLFRVDHLATRMRRNSENLLVLAGQDRESQDFEPVSLLDVARAAVSEIADYDRAQVGQLPGVQLLGVAADDVTHILAELLDNAMSKSPESAEVVIRGERTGDGTLIVSVEDSGIGIPVDRLNEINARLSRSPKVDVAVTRHMGLYVVGRLAHRHGIRVQLRERPYGGIAASVVIPMQLVGNDPDAPREIRPAQPGGRYQPLSGAGPQAPQLSIEARGADGLRAQRLGSQEPGAPFPGSRGAAQQPAADAGPGLRAMPGAQSGIGWPAGSRQPADTAQDAGLERPAPAPAAGYRDAVPVPKFEPADPSELPKRKPGALSAVNGIPAPETSREKAPVSAAEEAAIQSEADRIRSELSEFQLGQRAARSDVSGPGELQGDYGVGADADPGNGESMGDARAPDQAGENDGP
jgi:Histidine kinase-, DNA gyrase B-, and HSP90-like ATPase